MEPAGLTQLEELIKRAINLSVGVAFIALTIVLVWAGIQYLTSGGEPKAKSTANSTITWALLGIVFLALAWLLLKLVTAFTGADVTKFCFSLTGCP